MSGHTYTHTYIHTYIHTYTQDNYSNPRCACVPRVNKQIIHFCDTFVYTTFSYGGIIKKKNVQELLDSRSVSQSSKDVIIEDAGINRSPIYLDL